MPPISVIPAKAGIQGGFSSASKFLVRPIICRERLVVESMRPTKARLLGRFEQEEEAEMFVEICSARDSFSAELLKNLLEDNGFHPLEIRTASHVMIAGVDHGYFVQVPEDEVSEARKCLAENGQEATLL